MKATARILSLVAAAGLAATLGFAIASGSANAGLPATEKNILESGMKDKPYGDTLDEYLDGVVAVTSTFSVVTINSNSTMKIHAYRATRARVLKAPGTLMDALALKPSAAITVFFADTSGTVSGTGTCQNVTATAMTSLTLKAGPPSAGYIPLVAGKSGIVILNSAGTATLTISKTPTLKTYQSCFVLPNGRVVAGALSPTF